MIKKHKALTILTVLLFGTLAIAQGAFTIRSGDSTYTAKVNSDGELLVSDSGGGGGGGGSSSSPAKTTTTLTADADSCTTPGDADCTTILASTEIISYPHVALTIHNTGANAIDDVQVQFSPDGTTWENWDNTTFAALAATDGSDMKSMQIDGNSRRYIRVQARSASGSTADVWLNLSSY